MKGMIEVLFQPEDLNAKMRSIFAPHVDVRREKERKKEPVTMEIHGGGKTKTAVVEGRIVGVYAHGVLFERPFTREFLSYVDFYSGHVRVRSGAMKSDVAALLPDMYNLALMTVRDRPRLARTTA